MYEIRKIIKSSGILHQGQTQENQELSFKNRVESERTSPIFTTKLYEKL